MAVRGEEAKEFKRSAVVDAAVFSRVDKKELVLFQNRQSSDDDDGELVAFPATSYEGHSSVAF